MIKTRDEENKEIILKELNKIERKGAKELIKYLEKETDYFTAPASTKYHLSRKGGLAEHSLNVYKILKKKNETYKLEIKEETIIISGLLHDICKTNFYEKNENEENYKVKEKLPIGHGEKSIFILNRFIQLTKEEACAIRWHMLAFDASIHFPYPNGMSFSQAEKEHPLLIILFTSDYEASKIIEREK